jgi:beta-lactamase regulating signal transducer with metallopeptidase domain
MTTFDELTPLANAVVASLFNTVWQSLGLVLLVWLCLRLSRRLNAASRYLVWWGALLLIVLLTCLGIARARPRHGPDLPKASAPPTIPTIPTVQARLPAALDGSRVREDARDGVAQPVATQAPAIRAPHAFHGLTVTGRWPMLLLGGCLGLSVLLSSKLVHSLSHLRILKRNAEPVEAACRERFRALLNKHQITRPITLNQSLAITAPMAIGLGKPLILVPAKVLERLEADELDQVLLHEAAHLSRWDDWSNLGQQVLRAFFCFHPAVLWVCRRLSLERELACDDWVVCGRREPKAFARCLVKLAELARMTPESELATGMISSGRQLSRRIEALLDGKRAVSAGVSKIGCATVCLVLGMAGLVVSELPPVIVAQEAASGPRLETALRPQPVDSTKAATEKDEAFAVALKEAEAETEQERAKAEATVAAIDQDLRHQGTSGTGQIVVRVIHLRHISAAQVSRSLQPLLPEKVTIVPDERTNSIIISAPQISIQPLVEALGGLDTGIENPRQLPSATEDEEAVRKLQRKPADLEVQAATAEAVRRQANLIELRRTLDQAATTKKQGDLKTAAQLYEKALCLVSDIGVGVEGESKETMAGLTGARMQLAEDARKAGSPAEAEAQANRLLQVNPTKEVSAWRTDLRPFPPTETEQRAREDLQTRILGSLLETVKHETNAELRAHALVSLPRSEIEAHLDLLNDLVLNDTDSRVRKQALATLTSHHSLASTEAALKLYDQLSGKDSELKLTIIESLGVFPAQYVDRMAVADKAAAKLKRIVKEETDQRLRNQAIQQLGRIAQQLGSGG